MKLNLCWRRSSDPSAWSCCGTGLCTKLGAWSCCRHPSPGLGFPGLSGDKGVFSARTLCFPRGEGCQSAGMGCRRELGLCPGLGGCSALTCSLPALLDTLATDTALARSYIFKSVCADAVIFCLGMKAMTSQSRGTARAPRGSCR